MGSRILLISTHTKPTHDGSQNEVDYYSHFSVCFSASIQNFEELLRLGPKRIFCLPPGKVRRLRAFFVTAANFAPLQIHFSRLLFFDQ